MRRRRRFKALDLLITCDSAVAALAAALGVKVWVAMSALIGLVLAARSRRQPVVSDDDALSPTESRQLAAGLRTAAGGGARLRDGLTSGSTQIN